MTCGISRKRTAREASRYLRDPRCGFFNWLCRTLVFLRLGLLITKVPLPRYSALYSLSSAKGTLLEVPI